MKTTLTDCKFQSKPKASVATEGHVGGTVDKHWPPTSVILIRFPNFWSCGWKLLLVLSLLKRVFSLGSLHYQPPQEPTLPNLNEGNRFDNVPTITYLPSINKVIIIVTVAVIICMFIYLLQSWHHCQFKVATSNLRHQGLFWVQQHRFFQYCHL